jgi:hypothetical protein
VLYLLEAALGELGKAEDHAFALLQQGCSVDLQPLGAALELSDAELQRRGLDRAELLAALEELEELALPRA